MYTTATTTTTTTTSTTTTTTTTTTDDTNNNNNDNNNSGGPRPVLPVPRAPPAGAGPLAPPLLSCAVYTRTPIIKQTIIISLEA